MQIPIMDLTLIYDGRDNGFAFGRPDVCISTSAIGQKDGQRHAARLAIEGHWVLRHAAWGMLAQGSMHWSLQ